MTFELKWTKTAVSQYRELEAAAKREVESKTSERKGKKGKKGKGRQAGTFGQVAKAIRLLANNPAHPGLSVHKYDSLAPPAGCGEVWEAYAQNQTPGAYRIFWAYGPERKQITIVAITPHP